MNTKTIYKGYEFQYRNERRGTNGRVIKNGVMVFDTLKENSDRARIEMQKWADNQLASFAVPDGTGF